MITEKIISNNQQVIRKIPENKALEIKEVIDELYNSPLIERMYFDGDPDLWNILYGYETKSDGRIVFWNSTEDVIVKKNEQWITSKEELLSYI